MDRWTGKIAVVTGAAGGIGSAIVKKLLEYRLIVVGLSFTEQKLKNLNDDISKTMPSAKFHYIRCDVGNESDIIKAFEYITDNVGPVSILVNNAGTSTRLLLLDSTAETINKILHTNITGPALCTKEAVNSMLKNNINDGHIINIGSVVDTLPPTPPFPSIMYTLSKHGLRIMSEGVRQELLNKKTNIRVTHLSPGAVQTNIIADIDIDFKLNPEIIAETCISVLSPAADISIRQLTISSTREPLM